MAIRKFTVYPQSTDPPGEFANNGDIWIKQVSTQFIPDANALAVDVNAKSVVATEQAVIATEQADIAATQAELATTNGAAQVALAANQVTLAADQVTLAAGQVDLAEAQANNAASSAQMALLAPGTSATSTTSMEVGTGLKTFTIETGKLFVTGMTLKAYSAGNWINGTVISYDSETGALVLNGGTVFGSGTHSDWTISVSAPIPDVPGGYNLFYFNNFI